PKQAFLELDGCPPVELPEDLPRVESISPIVPWPVGHKFNLVFGLMQNAQQMPDHLQVCGRVPRPNVVDLPWSTGAQHPVQGSTVILDKDPIAFVQAITVNGEGLLFQSVGNHQRNKLLGELVGPVVVRTAGNNARETVGLPVTPDQ